MNSSTAAGVHIGVGFDTARYGHHVSFLREDRQPAAKAFFFTENQAGYHKVRAALDALQQRYGQVHFHIRIDAAGQYAANLEQFVRALPYSTTVSLGQPKQNKDYRSVHFPKRKSDNVESLTCARFAIVERPAARLPTPPAFAQLTEVLGYLQARVKQSTRLINQLHNHLTRTFPELAPLAGRVSSAWVLKLLRQYPTAEKIAAAPLEALTAIAHVDEQRARHLQETAQHSIASQRGPVIEEFIQQSVDAVLHSKQAQRRLEKLLEKAYAALPASKHVFIDTIPGIGRKTAAALVGRMISIDRFQTPNQVAGLFGVFPEESTSGTDKFGKPVPPGTMHMSRKGNDLVRGYLWNAAKSAIRHNPTIRRLYARQRAAGKRGDVALGHCMNKLLHLVFAVWQSGKPYAPPTETAVVTETAAPPRPAVVPQQTLADVTNEVPAPDERAVGRKEQCSERQAVTTATAMVDPAAAADKQEPPRRYVIDFAELRRQLSIEQVLREAGWLERLQARGSQLRGPCPIHGAQQPRSRSFSVHVHKNVFHCFDASCGAKGNALDLWAQIRKLPLYEAAKDISERLGLQQRNREEEPVNEPVPQQTSRGS